LPYEILLQHVSIVPCLCVFGISHFGLYYLYSSTKVCTLEVEAVVIENEPYWTTTGDGESVRRYRQIGEYTVDNKKITLTITDQKTDPVPEGTKITLWVNPDNPYNFINSREINLIDIVVPIAIPIGIMLFGVLGLVFNLKKEQ